MPPKVFIELSRSRIHGIGVFAVSAIERDEKIADGIHAGDYESLVSWAEYQDFHVEVRRKIMAFCIGTPAGFLPPEGLDFNKLSIEWYLNHSCAGNCGFDDNGDFIALRNITPGGELTYDYGLAESNPTFRMRCMCETPSCRTTITGDDWKDQTFQARHRRYMLPGLRR
jgi:hypothetical protein